MLNTRYNLLTMPNFTNSEMADMHFIYGLANGNAREARRLYMERYPNRIIPNHKIFSSIHRRLVETGTLKKIMVMQVNHVP